MRRTLLVVVGLLSALAFATPALAQTVPSLTGEVLQGDGMLFPNPFEPDRGNRAECDPDGTSTMHFTETGVAAGPYPGTFEEEVTVSVGPQVSQGAPFPMLLVGPVVSFEATFTISSAGTTIRGTKQLLVAVPGSFIDNEGGCMRLQLETGAGTPYPDLANLTYEEFFARVRFSYEATIETPTGVFRDTGEGFHRFDEGRFEGRCTTVPRCGQDGDIENFFYSQGGMQEFFTRSDGVVPVEQDAAVVVVTPPTAINTVGTQHTMTATATTVTGGPAEGIMVFFTVEGASDVQGQCTTNAQGQCTFTYSGPQFPGADLITACADNDESGAAETGEPCGEATKVWVLPATVPGKVTGGGWIVVGGEKVSFSFNAQSKDVGDEAQGKCNVVDHATKLNIKCLTVDSLVVTPTQATFFGQARVGSTTTDYRIDVDDLGGAGVADTFKIQTASGYTAGGPLQGGNIQIHRSTPL